MNPPKSSESAAERPRLIILGAAGHGREVAQLLRTGAVEGPEWVGGPEGFLDDDPSLRGVAVDGLPVLGPLDWTELAGFHAVLGVGYPEMKRRVVGRLSAAPKDWPPVLARLTSIGDDAYIEAGTLVQSGCVITSGVHLLEFSTINLAATLSHDVHVGAFSTVSPGAHIGGDVRIGEGAFVGIGATVIQGITIGEWSVVGAGAAVTRDVEPNTVVAGVPARIISRREPGWQVG